MDALSCCKKVSNIDVLSCYWSCNQLLGTNCYENSYVLLVIKLSFKCIVLMPTLNLSQCFVDDKSMHLLLVNFSYKQVDNLSKCQKKALILYHLVDVSSRFLSLSLGFWLVDLGRKPIGPTYFFHVLYYNE